MGLGGVYCQVRRPYRTKGHDQEDDPAGIMGQILKPLIPAYGGYTIARDDRVIFIKGAIPGEVVEVRIEEKKRDYSVASVSRVIEPSEDRIAPQCAVFGICGGCH